MKWEKKTVLNVTINIMWIVIGMVLVSLAYAGKVDSFWNGMGSGLLIVGIIHLLRIRRLNRNADYREKVEIAENDERNHFLRGKAWAWSGYLFIIICAVSSIVLRIAGQDLLSMAASGAVCLMLILFWGSYMILKRKY